MPDEIYRAARRRLHATAGLPTPSRRTIPVAIALFAGEHVEPCGQIAAASVVATLPLAMLTLLFQKRIVAGVTFRGGEGGSTLLSGPRGATGNVRGGW